MLSQNRHRRAETSRSMCKELRLGKVASSAHEVTHGANETGAASVQLLTSAELLSRQSSRLKHELDSFLNGIQAA